MSRPPGLIAYLSLTALGAPAARRRIAGEMARGGTEAARLAERLGQPGLRRPEGPLVWLHAAGPGQAGPVVDLARRLAEDAAEASFLMTSEAPIPGPLPPRTLHQFTPDESSRAIAAFLDHWRPDVGIWAGATLRPALIHAAAARRVPIALVDAAGAPDPIRGWRGWPRLARATLRVFPWILATDDPAARLLVGVGADPDSVEVTGPLAQDGPPPECNLRERDALADLLKARPVWLAACVTQAEEAAVVAAHRVAARLAHRLLLILVPATPGRGPALAAALAEQDLTVALRSVEGDPGTATQIFIADAEGELGLWYRLAPMTFMGGTLDPAGGGSRSPHEPAGLGSAILHGPETGQYAALYRRLAEANACRALRSDAELGDAVAELLSPDRAATMAHAAWRVSTGGADTYERIRTLIGNALAGAPA